MANSKLIDLDVFETSGVDRAAHLHDGFVVMKSADKENQIKAQLLTALGMSEEDNLSSVQEQIDLAVAKAVGEYDEKVANLEAALEAAKNQATDLASKLEEIQSMKTNEEEMDDEEVEMEMDEEMKSYMEEMPEELAKSVKELPSEQRSIMAKAFKAQADEIRKERDVRLDAEAVAKSKESYKNVGIDHDSIAPALRRLTESNPEIAKAVESVLAAAEAQVAESGLLKELGTANGSTPSVVDEAKAIAKSFVESGVAKTIEQGIEKALDANPELAKRYMEEVTR
jgi:hypothetical protein